MKRPGRGLLFITVIYFAYPLLFGSYCSWPRSFFLTDIFNLKYIIAEKTGGNVEAGPMNLWFFKEAIIATVVVLILALTLSRTCLKKLLQNRNKHVRNTAVFLLTLLFMELFYSGYAHGRGLQIKRRLTLTPGNTLVRLSYWAGIGGRGDPARVLFCGDLPEERIDALRDREERQRGWTSDMLDSHKPTPLTPAQMEEVISLLDNRFFSMGPWCGPWGYVDGIVMYISVSDGTNTQTISGWTSSNKAKRLENLYDDLIEIAERSELAGPQALPTN